MEPIHLVTYFSDEPTDALMALGLRNYWDGYFAGRAAPLGLVPAEVVHAVFYNFADGEVARHIPRVWDMATPAGGARRPRAGQRRGAEADSGRPRRRPRSRACRRPRHQGGDQRARRRDGSCTPRSGRSRCPSEPVARLWHAATLLREHRGDGHIAALVAAGIGGTEAHVLHALSEDIPAEKFGRVHHLAADRLAG